MQGKIIIVILNIFLMPVYLFGSQPLPLEGKIIMANPGHGWRYIDDVYSSWGYERTTTYGVTEDIHNAYRISYFLSYVNINGGGMGLSPRDVEGVHQYDYLSTSPSFSDTWPGSINPSQLRYRISPRYLLHSGYNPLNRGTVPATVYDTTYVSTEVEKTRRARVYYNNWVYDQTHSSNEVYLAFHSNAGGGTSRGMDTYIGTNTYSPAYWDYDGSTYTSTRAYWVSRAKVLGANIHNRTIQLVRDYWDAGVNDRGIHYTSGISHELTRPKNMAILLEHFFHDNATEAEWLKTPKFQKLLAQGAYKGICDYYGVDYNLPTAITDLEATSGSQSNQITLSWTATGEAGDTDFTNTAYLVKYATSPITNETLFSTATTYPQSITPKCPGVTETLIVSNFSSVGVYYFAIKSKNWTDDWSRLSNCASATIYHATTNITTTTNTNTRDTDISAVNYAVFEKFKIQNKVFTPGGDVDYNNVIFQFTDGDKSYAISIYDVGGELVADDAQFSKSKENGEIIIRWEGRDKNGNLVSSGVYFYVLRIEGQMKKGVIVVCR